MNKLRTKITVICALCLLLQSLLLMPVRAEDNPDGIDGDPSQGDSSAQEQGEESAGQEPEGGDTEPDGEAPAPTDPVETPPETEPEPAPQQPETPAQEQQGQESGQQSQASQRAQALQDELAELREEWAPIEAAVASLASDGKSVANQLNQMKSTVTGLLQELTNLEEMLPGEEESEAEGEAEMRTDPAVIEERAREIAVDAQAIQDDAADALRSAQAMKQNAQALQGAGELLDKVTALEARARADGSNAALSVAEEISVLGGQVEQAAEMEEGTGEQADSLVVQADEVQIGAKSALSRAEALEERARVLAAELEEAQAKKGGKLWLLLLLIPLAAVAGLLYVRQRNLKRRRRRAHAQSHPQTQTRPKTASGKEETVRVNGAARPAQTEQPEFTLDVEAIDAGFPSMQAESAPPYRVGSNSHIGTRKEQQDALYVSDPADMREDHGKLLAVVCDGMGGMANGEKASRLAVDTLVKDFRAAVDLENIPAFLRQEAHKIDMLVHDSLNGAEGEQSGSTLVSVVLDGNKLYWLSVGDSRLYILRREQMVQVTRDHNFRMVLDQKVQAGEMTEEEAETQENSEALISFMGIGGLEVMDINRTPFLLEKDDILLLCSDGLTKSLSNAQIQKFLMENSHNLPLCSTILAMKAQEHCKTSSQDNTTVVIIRYTE